MHIKMRIHQSRNRLCREILERINAMDPQASHISHFGPYSF
jgi:hypothetical protein